MLNLNQRFPCQQQYLGQDWRELLDHPNIPYEVYLQFHNHNVLRASCDPVTCIQALRYRGAIRLKYPKTPGSQEKSLQALAEAIKERE